MTYLTSIPFEIYTISDVFDTSPLCTVYYRLRYGGYISQMPPSKLKELESIHEEPLETLIPRTIEECGSVLAAAKKLNRPQQSIDWWLARNGYVVERHVIARVIKIRTSASLHKQEKTR